MTSFKIVAMAPISWNRCYVLGGRKTSPTALTSYASYYDIISHIHCTRLSAKEESGQPLKGKFENTITKMVASAPESQLSSKGFMQLLTISFFLICFTHSESTFKLTTSYSIWPTKSYEVRIYCSKNFL